MKIDDLSQSLGEYKNLFISLHKHKPEEGKTPTENFLTEAFAFILRLENKMLLRYLLKKIFVDEGKIRRIKNDVEVETQFPIKFSKSQTKYADICIHSKDMVVLIENKVESGRSYSRDDADRYKPQTEFYRKYLDSRKELYKKLITITKYHQEKDSCVDEKISWQQVYGWTKDCIENLSASDTGELFRYNVACFLELLEGLEMKPIKILSEDAEVIKRFEELDKGVKQVLSDVEEQIHKKYGWDKSGKNTYRSFEDKKLGVVYAWGSSNNKTSNNISFRFYFYLCEKGKDWTLEIDFPFRGNKMKVNKIREKLINAKHNYRLSPWDFYKPLKLPRDFCKYEPEQQKKCISEKIIFEIEKLTRGKGRLLEDN